MSKTVTYFERNVGPLVLKGTANPETWEVKGEVGVKTPLGYESIGPFTVPLGDKSSFGSSINVLGEEGNMKFVKLDNGVRVELDLPIAGKHQVDLFKWATKQKATIIFHGTHSATLKADTISLTLEFTEQVQSLTRGENDYRDLVFVINDEERLRQGGSFKYANTRGETMEDLEITFYHGSTNAKFSDAVFGGEIMRDILPQGFLKGTFKCTA